MAKLYEIQSIGTIGEEAEHVLTQLENMLSCRDFDDCLEEAEDRTLQIFSELLKRNDSATLYDVYVGEAVELMLANIEKEKVLETLPDDYLTLDIRARQEFDTFAVYSSPNESARYTEEQWAFYGNHSSLEHVNPNGASETVYPLLLDGMSLKAFITEQTLNNVFAKVKLGDDFDITNVLREAAPEKDENGNNPWNYGKFTNKISRLMESEFANETYGNAFLRAAVAAKLDGLENLHNNEVQNERVHQFADQINFYMNNQTGQLEVLFDEAETEIDLSTTGGAEVLFEAGKAYRDNPELTVEKALQNAYQTVQTRYDTELDNSISLA